MDELTDSAARNSTVDRALRVMESFLGPESELGVLELSRQLDLDKSVIHRILATLVRRRFVEQDPVTRRYRVGLRAWEIGQRYLAGQTLEEIATGELQRIVSQHRYATGYFSTLDGGDVVVVSTVRGPGPLTLHIDPGTRLAAELTATGRALLAQLPAVQAERLVARRRQAGLGGRTPGSMRDLARDLAATRERGYAMHKGDYVPGVGTVATVIRSSTGTPLAALTVDFFISAETEDLWDVLPGQLDLCIKEIERNVEAVSAGVEL